MKKATLKKSKTKICHIQIANEPVIRYNVPEKIEVEAATISFSDVSCALQNNDMDKEKTEVFVNQNWDYLVEEDMELQRLRKIRFISSVAKDSPFFTDNEKTDSSKQSTSIDPAATTSFLSKSKNNTKVLQINWCSICGQDNGSLKKCSDCASSFHEQCFDEARIMILSNVKTPCITDSNSFILKVLHKMCINCIWGDRIGSGSIVLHKLKSFPWWPALILSFNSLPKCLKSPPSPKHFPVKYYHSDNYAWATMSEICSIRINLGPLIKTQNHNLLLALKLVNADKPYDIIDRTKKYLMSSLNIPKPKDISKQEQNYISKPGCSYKS